MVEHIRWLIGFQGASANKAEASENWKDDLAWIRKVLAPRVGFTKGRNPSTKFI